MSYLQNTKRPKLDYGNTTCGCHETVDPPYLFHFMTHLSSSTHYTDLTFFSQNPVTPSSNIYIELLIDLPNSFCSYQTTAISIKHFLIDSIYNITSCTTTNVVYKELLL